MLQRELPIRNIIFLQDKGYFVIQVAVMPFGFRKEGEEKQQIITNITDKEDLEEIKKIAKMLNPNEEVFVVARQYRLKPGGSRLLPCM
jgi:uncharacterized protein (DUF1697 family)